MDSVFIGSGPSGLGERGFVRPGCRTFAPGSSSLKYVVSAVALATLSLAPMSYAAEDTAADRASATVKQMTAEEKTILTHGIMPLPIFPHSPKAPADAIPGAGYVAGIPRLDIPALKETDAGLGVTYLFGARGDGATALPSALAQASGWNPALVREGGAMIGGEARAKGFNVLLAGGVNLMRDPRNGRTFEYFSEDPLLSGVLAGNSIVGIQSNNIISTIKHFAINGQETGRKVVNSKLADAAARESDLLAFQLGIEIGNPGSVMCSYNLVNGEPGCASEYLLQKVLKDDWRYKGFVMSDWGAVPGVEAAFKGLDQQSAAEFDKGLFLAKPLADAAAKDPAIAARLDDMNKRILWSIYANRLDSDPSKPGGKIDFAKNAKVAEEIAKQGIVLLRNSRDVLPLAKTARRIAIIGGYASVGVPSGGGSSQVQGEGGAVASIPRPVDGPFAALAGLNFHRSSPMNAIKSLAPQTTVTFRDGTEIRDAVESAKKADVAIIFATKWSTEGYDQADLSLPAGQDELIAAVAAANPNTIVVLETGNPVLMPWLDKTAAVLQAWYPGARGGEAIASVLFGDTNPSGRLPITFPAAESQLPRAVIDGFFEYEPDFFGLVPEARANGLTADYDIEGSDVGYRWNKRSGQKALFPFGFGLSYTTFANENLKVRGLDATLTVRNTGPRSGATVAQLYLVSRDGKPKQRLVGFQRVELAAGSSTGVKLKIDPRLLADWNGNGWTIAEGDYGFAYGDSAETLGPVVTVKMRARSWKD